MAYSAQDLLDEYIYQRQQNVRTDQVLQLLMQLKPDMTREERQQLSQWIREWELGRQEHAYAEPPDDEGTKPVVSERNTVSVASEVVCPHCTKRNPVESKYCYSCGQLLTGGIPAATDRLYAEVDDPATFGSFSTLVIMVRSYEQHPLKIKVGDTPMVIGRSDAESPNRPEIDLGPYGAKEMGVSRHHAILNRMENTLTLTDQGSVNHTFINGEKLHPHEVRVIRDGDEIRFGRLTTRFAFHRELRRLFS